MGSQGLGVIPRHDSIHGDVPVRLAVFRKWRRIDITPAGPTSQPGPELVHLAQVLLLGFWGLKMKLSLGHLEK
jgi:hypothetical protein